MTKKSEVSITDRIVAATLHKEGMSLKQIAERISRSVSTVSDVIRRFKATEQFENRPRSGRPKISTAREDRKLIRLSRKNRTAPSPLLSTHWALTSGKLPSSRTVRRRLQEAGYEWKRAAKKPRLTKAHKIARKHFCNHVKSWSIEKWRTILFSDEMNIEVDNRKGRIMLRRLPSEKYHPDCIVERTRAGSGSTRLWACMSGYGFGLFQLFNGRLNLHSYIDIIDKNLVASKKKLKMPNSFIFQQDNAPCHRAKSVANWMKRRNVKTLQWPPNSPDLNPIENLWSWLDGKLAKEELKRFKTSRLQSIEFFQMFPTT